jgi:hypothetical protein
MGFGLWSGVKTSHLRVETAAMEIDTVEEQLSDQASEEAAIGGEAKRLREGDEDKDDGVGDHEEYMDDDEIHFLDYYRRKWVEDYGKTGSFEDESE